MITMSDVASPSPNLDHILSLRQDQLLLNAIVGSVSATLVQFISTSATSGVVWTTLKKTYASHLPGRIMTHHQNLTSPQQGNWTITNYMQDVKHNIDFLVLMNVSFDFDEHSIHVLNGLGPTYSNISHALQARDTLLTSMKLFEHLLSYEAQLPILVPYAPPTSIMASAIITLTCPSFHRQSKSRGERIHNRSQ